MFKFSDVTFVAFVPHPDESMIFAAYFEFNRRSAGDGTGEQRWLCKKLSYRPSIAHFSAARFSREASLHSIFYISVVVGLNSIFIYIP